MARRTGENPPLLTVNRRAAFPAEHTRFHGGWWAFSWSFVLYFSALSCGYCGADTEFSILEEAQVLADQMKKLSSQELGVFTMQVSLQMERFQMRKTEILLYCFESSNTLKGQTGAFIIVNKNNGCNHDRRELCWYSGGRQSCVAQDCGATTCALKLGHIYLGHQRAGGLLFRLTLFFFKPVLVIYITNTFHREIHAKVISCHPNDRPRSDISLTSI